MNILKTKKFLTYLVVGALISGLILSCKNDDKTGSPPPDTKFTDGNGGSQKTLASYAGDWYFSRDGADVLFLQ